VRLLMAAATLLNAFAETTRLTPVGMCELGEPRFQHKLNIKKSGCSKCHGWTDGFGYCRFVFPHGIDLLRSKRTCGWAEVILALIYCS
jgi:hypothetical protein